MESKEQEPLQNMQETVTEATKTAENKTEDIKAEEIRAEENKKEDSAAPDETAEKNKKLIPGIFAALAVICVLAGGMKWYGIHHGGEEYSKIQEKAVISSTGATLTEADTDATAIAAQSAAYAATTAVSAEQVPIDFKELQKDCPDAYAWIRIPGTQIDYPVCQVVEGDQNFYLNHRADKASDYAGAIFSENYNKRDFTDPVTVLYGHDMSNGTMFQNLHSYRDRAFFDKNREVLIYLPDKVLHYRVFAAYDTNDDHLLLSNDNFTDPAVFYSFMQDILTQRSISGFVDQETKLDLDSRILTLSTCNEYDDQRYLVQCVLQQDGN